MLNFFKTKLKKWVLGRWTRVPDPYDHPQVIVGKNTYGLTPFTVNIFTEHDRVIIGSFCSFAPGVKIMASGEHFYERVSTFPLTSNILCQGVERDTRIRGPVEIGPDTWVGTGAIILSGTTIGPGAVIAAGAVVTGIVPSYAVVGGIPAKVIRYRFNKVQCDKLQKIAWWEWPDELLLDRIERFYGDVDEFIRLFDVESTRS